MMMNAGETGKDPTMTSLGVIILAAGASSRMGRAKMLLPWKEITLLGHMIELWKQIAPAQLVVVCAAGDVDIAAELERIGLPRASRIINPNPARGMFSSIQCAARSEGWNPRLTHWAIALGDQPHVRPATLRALVDFATRNPATICQPAFQDRPRHPVLLPQFAWKELATSKDESLRHFLKARSGNVRLLPVDDPGVELDLDDPADYERAMNRMTLFSAHADGSRG
jgi:molybdenum cofactor cytidylyltransferase